MQQFQPDLTAAEAHGIATGMLCANHSAKPVFWLAELLPENVVMNEESKQVLTHFFEETRRVMLDDDFEFEPFLPSDSDTLLNEQIEALKNWCQGFLFGVGSTVQSTDFSPSALEILKDIAEFTRLDTEAEGEEDEAAFMEINEYLRAAVILLKYELVNQLPTTLH